MLKEMVIRKRNGVPTDVYAHGWPERVAMRLGSTICCGILLIASLGAAPNHSAAQVADTSLDRFLVVDCLLPGQRKRIGTKYTYIGARRPVRTTAADCAIRGGEYVEYDRANYKSARKVWLKEAKAGNAEAQNYLGEMAEKGLGADRDYAEAKRWYELAAAQGNSAAQFNLGKLYESGLGVPVDREKALDWYRQASGLPELNTSPNLEPASLEADDGGVDDPAAPSIELIDPLVPNTRGVAVTGVPASVSERLIIGKVTTISDLRSVTVNDLEIAFEPNGIFQTRIPIASDGSKVVIVAVDNDGRRGTRSFVLRPKSTDVAHENTNFGTYHALVIGNNDYKYINPLSTARNDAKVVGQLLASKYGFEVTPLLDATRKQMMEALNELNKTLTDEDNLLVYYAGHGTLDEKNDRGHWLPINAKPDDTTEWVSNTALTDLLNIMSARHILVVSDSCYSGSLTRTTATSLRSGQTPEQLAADQIVMNKKRSRTALTSGGLQPVLDEGAAGHSVFAYALIKALRENSDVLDGQRLMLQIRSRVAQAAYDKERFEQVPVYAPINLAGHEFGEFHFVPLN